MRIIESRKGGWNWTCSICGIEIENDEDVWQCPYCHHIAHLDEAMEWLRERRKCPVCQKYISPGEGKIIIKRKKMPNEIET